MKYSLEVGAWPPTKNSGRPTLKSELDKPGSPRTEFARPKAIPVDRVKPTARGRIEDLRLEREMNKDAY